MWNSYKTSNAWMVGLLVLVVGGCRSPTWEPVKGQLQEESLKVTIEIPEGWHRFRDGSSDIVLTRNGLALQSIRLSKKSLEVLNEDSKKKLSGSFLPHEVANWVAEQFTASTRFMNQQIVETTAATVAGHPGYRLFLGYRTAEGLSYKVLQYGYLHEEALYQLTFEAVARVYYDRDVSTFEHIRTSYQESGGAVRKGSVNPRGSTIRGEGQ